MFYGRSRIFLFERIQSKSFLPFPLLELFSRGSSHANPALTCGLAPPPNACDRCLFTFPSHIHDKWFLLNSKPQGTQLIKILSLLHSRKVQYKCRILKFNVIQICKLEHDSRKKSNTPANLLIKIRNKMRD